MALWINRDIKEHAEKFQNQDSKENRADGALLVHMAGACTMYLHVSWYKDILLQSNKDKFIQISWLHHNF